MKGGLRRIPSVDELAEAAEALRREGPPDAARLALWGQWCRFDARMAELWVVALARVWRQVNPVALHEAALEQPWPSVVGVLLELVDRRISRAERVRYRGWKTATCAGIPKAPWQQFFIGLDRIAGPRMQDEARYAAKEYRRWGFLSREPVAAPKERVGVRRSLTVAPDVRRALLADLLRSRGRITVQEYLDALPAALNRRQAQRDLASFSGASAIGRTRACWYAAKVDGKSPGSPGRRPR